MAIRKLGSTRKRFLKNTTRKIKTYQFKKRGNRQ